MVATQGVLVICNPCGTARSLPRLLTFEVSTRSGVYCNVFGIDQCPGVHSVVACCRFDTFDQVLEDVQFSISWPTLLCFHMKRFRVVLLLLLEFNVTFHCFTSWILGVMSWIFVKNACLPIQSLETPRQGNSGNNWACNLIDRGR